MAKNSPLFFWNLANHIRDAFNTMDGGVVANYCNQVLRETVSYDVDGVWVIGDTSFDTDEIADKMLQALEVMDEGVITQFYNSMMERKIKYLGERLWEWTVSIEPSEAEKLMIDMVSNIQHTGGLVTFTDGFYAPAVDPVWTDMGDSIMKMQTYLINRGIAPELTIDEVGYSSKEAEDYVE